MAPTEGRVARPERRWGCRRGTPLVWRKGWSYGVGNGSMSSPVVTSYRLPIVTIGLTVFTVLRLITDSQTDEIGLAKGGTMH